MSKKQIVPTTKGNQKDVYDKQDRAKAHFNYEESRNLLYYRAMRSCNNYWKSCTNEYTVMFLERDQINSCEIDQDGNKIRTVSIPQDEEAVTFLQSLVHKVEPWVGLTLDTKTSASQNLIVSSILYAATLQRVLQSGFKRVSWYELPDDLAQEYDEYTCGILYYRYGALFHAFFKIRIRFNNFEYAYSDLDWRPSRGASIEERERAIGKEACQAECVGIRHDMGVEISRSEEYWKGDPDRTLEVAQDISHDEADINLDDISQQL